ncbi:TIR domain-containing protein [Clostridium sp. VAP51]|uniref:TIR domain-containing protein n=1 Tax=Clostridium sp. VAP51 TaxID=2949978 RepID=UPI00207A20FA|nr:TIR domain-containing protein [Clostridium sp. VAP51]
MASIFLSHNSKDKKFVRELAGKLKNYNVKVWIDEAEIKIGDSLVKKIEHGIDDMDYLGVVLSPNSIESEWVTKEVDMAMNSEIFDKRVKVLPLLYKKCDITGFLKGKLYADFTSKKKYEESFHKLLDTLNVDEKDSQRVSGNSCIIEKDFRNIINNYFESKDVELQYFEDFSGIDYIKMQREDKIFTLYSYWTKPTISELLNTIFNKQANRKLKDIEFMDEYIYSDDEREKFMDELLCKYKLPKDSYPAQWNEISEHGNEAMIEWENWIEERRVIALIFE